MSCNSAIYCANTSTQQTLVNTNINFGNIVRRYGSNIGMEGGNVVIKGVGYYSINVNINADASSTAMTIKLLKDGAEIAGAIASLTTTSGNAYQVSIPALIRQTCCCESQITAVIDAGTITSASIEVTKL